MQFRHFQWQSWAMGAGTQEGATLPIKKKCVGYIQNNTKREQKLAVTW